MAAYCATPRERQRLARGRDRGAPSSSLLPYAGTGSTSLALADLLLVGLALTGRTTEALRDEARTDEPTGLANRRELLRVLSQSAAAAARERAQPCALLMLDLDRFKELNDTLGHHTGDLVLATLGARRRAALSDGETLARLGGDEFAVVAAGGREEAVAAARRLQAALERPFEVEGLSVQLGASIGIACGPDHGADATTPIPVSVNVTAIDLVDDAFPALVAARLKRHVVPPGFLRLEITEQALFSDSERVADTLERLAAIGVALALDDFGTGYSSLARLKVAEGIEDDATRRVLQEVCDSGQGFLIGRPMAAPAFLVWLRARAASAGAVT